MNARNGHDDNYYKSKMSNFIKFFWYIRLFEIYPNADYYGVKLNWWHPISYVMLILSIVHSILFGGIPLLLEYYDDNKFNFTYEKYFRKNLHLIEHIKRP